MKFRKLFLKIHLYLGLSVGLLFALVGLTGSLLVFGEEIDRALNPALLTVAPAQEKASISSVENSVKTAFPQEKILRIRMPRDPEDVYEFWLNSNEGLRVYLNPYTAEVTGSRVFSQSWRGRLFHLHTQLFSGETGKTVIGISAVFFLLLGATGALLWWRGLRNLKRGLTVKLRAGWKRFNYDLHNALGIFAFLFLSVSAITGIYLVFNQPFEKTIFRLTNTAPRPRAPLSQLPATEQKPLSLEEILARSDKIWSEAETVWIYPPQTPTAAYFIRKKFPAESHPSGRSFLYFDQYTGELLERENALEVSRTTKIVNDLYPLHIGRIGGVATKILQVAIGATPLILLVTGFLMYRNRGRKTKGHYSRADKYGAETGGDKLPKFKTK